MKSGLVGGIRLPGFPGIQQCLGAIYLALPSTALECAAMIVGGESVKGDPA
jgi:hypothetical protein